MRAIAWLAAVAITAALSAGCGSSPPPKPPTPYQRYTAALARVGLQPNGNQAATTARANHFCSVIANVAEDYPGQTDVVYPAVVTEVQKDHYTGNQASVIVRTVIEDFCPQWKVLLRDG
jgi:hypothetical protein